jgi:Protein of unknown function TPD sequence-motif
MQSIFSCLKGQFYERAISYGSLIKLIVNLGNWREPTSGCESSGAPMLQAEYDEVVRSMRTRQDVGTCAVASGGRLAYETLLAVYEQAYIGRMARSSYLAKKHGKQFVARFEHGQSLLDVAEWINLSPCMVARRFLELKLNAGRQGVSRMLRKPELIQDERIRKAVEDCLRSDEHAGPYVDRRHAVVGLEYEFILMEKLRNLGLEFETESDLRARGAVKTPDILLAYLWPLTDVWSAG